MDARAAASLAPGTETPQVRWKWDVKIPMRDGVLLAASLYQPTSSNKPLPCIFSLTPYIAQRYHEPAITLAARGYVTLNVDVRGRGNSQGVFVPFVHEARDGHDIVSWLAKQPYCDGKIAMRGGSYGGYDQWMTASTSPEQLATIMPVASPFPGLDFPMRYNVFLPYSVQWLTLVAGKASQERIFRDEGFWGERFQQRLLNHEPFADLDEISGLPSPIFDEWVAHPRPDTYWDRMTPTTSEYQRINIPVLTMTGQFDGDQPGALEFYRRHLAGADPASKRHYLIIGPWDHAQTRAPTLETGGLVLGEASRIDMTDLDQQWYDWTLKGKAKPEFLKDYVAYYVTGAETWRYAPSLASVTAESRELHLHAPSGDANDAFGSGLLVSSPQVDGDPDDEYTYDPLDTGISELEMTSFDRPLFDQRDILLARGKALIYHTAPFDRAIEIAGFFRLTAWLSIDQPDTDFHVGIYEITSQGESLELTRTIMRARYRENLREERLIMSTEPQQYEFNTFPFVARRLDKGSRLRLVFRPLDSMYMERNYNSGKAVAHETAKDARSVRVRLLHDSKHASVLQMPIGAGSTR